MCRFNQLALLAFAVFSFIGQVSCNSDTESFDHLQLPAPMLINENGNPLKTDAKNNKPKSLPIYIDFSEAHLHAKKFDQNISVHIRSLCRIPLEEHIEKSYIKLDLSPEPIPVINTFSVRSIRWLAEQNEASIDCELQMTYENAIGSTHGPHTFQLNNLNNLTKETR